MGARQAVLTTAPILILVGALFCSGCSSPYMRNRGFDAMDMFDGGITTSEKPRFALYLGFFNFVTVGYSNFDGTLHGICGREFGKFPALHHCGGAFLWGRETLGYNDALDPSKPGVPDSYAVGPLGLALGPRPPFRQTLNCPKLLHLGWVGVALNCHFPEFADFFLGWLGMDIYDDDVVGRPAVKTSAEAPAPK